MASPLEAASGALQPAVPRALAAGELRRALLGERGDAFGIVLRAAQLALEIALLVELLLERTAPGFVDRLLGARETARRRGASCCAS